MELNVLLRDAELVPLLLNLGKAEFVGENVFVIVCFTVTLTVDVPVLVLETLVEADAEAVDVTEAVFLNGVPVCESECRTTLAVNLNEFVFVTEAVEVLLNAGVFVVVTLVLTEGVLNNEPVLVFVVAIVRLRVDDAV